MSRGNLTWLLVVPGLMLVGLLVTYSAPPPEQDYQMVRNVVDVLAAVDKNYYRALTPEEKKKFVGEMINGGLHSLDDHSQYFDEDALSRFDDENAGEFGGVGLVMTTVADEPHLVVESPMPGTPAYEAGLAPGDVILKIDGRNTEGFTVPEARRFVVGKPGTNVTLTMLRGGKKVPEDVTLTRALIEQHAVYGYERDPKDPAKWLWFADPADKIAMIRLERFNGKTTQELKPVLERIVADGAKGIIIDLRSNGGGLLNEAIDVSNLFFTDGDIVSTRDRNGDGRRWSAEAGKAVKGLENIPLAILIDRFSASASEIVAAALQDRGRAVIIGERSFGKGTVQKLFKLPPDEKRALKLTAETYWPPSGRRIHRENKMWDAADPVEWGVLPNPGYAMNLSLDERRKQALHRRKIDIVPGKPGVAPANVARKPDEKLPEGYQDPVIEKAIVYLREKIK